MPTVTFAVAPGKAAGLGNFDFSIIHSTGAVEAIASTESTITWTGAIDGDYEAAVSSTDANGVHQIDPNMLAFSVSSGQLNVAQGDGILTATVTVY